MGCDIHAFAEIKIAGTWHRYAEVVLDRSYDLFAKMAGVRNYEEIVPISGPRGLPDDISAVVRLEADGWRTDAHSKSWLSFDEVCSLDAERPGRFGYLFGNHWADKTWPKEVEDARLVFWFDN